MIYTLKEYAAAFHSNKNERTVYRMIASGLLPFNHKKVKGCIQVVDLKDYEDVFLVAFRDYIKAGIFTHESAATFCCETGFEMHRFCNIMRL